jgi:CelD/BcsL family acetyltransferase involved in cellulose biosynthesis
MTESISCDKICDSAAFAALEHEWWGLWRRSAVATPFQSPAWLLPWWRNFAPGELLVFTARQSGRLVGLAPFYVETGRRGRRVLPVGISVTDYHDVLVDAELGDVVCDALAWCMATQQDVQWDAWEFTELAAGAQALHLDSFAGCEEFADHCSACPVLTLPATIEALPQVLPFRKRRALRLARNRATRQGSVEIETAEASSAPRMLEALVRLHGARWQARGETGVLSDPRVQEFHRDVVPRLADARLLRLYEFRIAARAVAVYYGFLHRDCAYAYLTGFDPNYEFESPGVLLLGHAIEQAHREGAREFHFLRGQETYKYQWGAVDRWNRRRVFQKVNAYARAS